MDVLHNWYFFAFSTPLIWAIICLVDSCVVGHNIYRSPWDGPIISGLFSAAPLLIWVLLTSDILFESLLVDATAPLRTPDQLVQIVKATGTSCGAALMYFLHIYFYFRALFQLNDVANTEAVMALSVVIVPGLAWFILDERLSGAFYLVTILACIGLVVTAWSTLRRIALSKNTETQNAKRLDMSVSLLLAVLCISLSLVLQAKALDGLSFSALTISFSATTFFISVAALLIFDKYRQKLIIVLQQYYPIFLCAESLEVVARLAGQRAIEIGPSVTAVALVQSTLPIIIISFSLVLIGTDRIRNFLSPVLRETLALQSQSMQTKATLFIVSIAAVLILQQNVEP